MIARHSTNLVVRALISAIWIGAGAESAMAQSYSVNGQVGYLEEWEIKANVAKTITDSGVSYDGAVTLRHVGLCSVNGPRKSPASCGCRFRDGTPPSTACGPQG